ncbi:MAG: hypothetical protein PHS54_07405, partial [Clostridia bacterium]|nr:hypothetical protein [Clostridia bacterium]
MNNGKIFEQEIKASVPTDMFYYRFKDGTASWGKSDNTRFQAHNICDCMLFDGQMLYLLELKSHKGKSIPKSCIRPTQMIELLQADCFDNVDAGFLFNFRDVGRTFYMSVSDVAFVLSQAKSVSIKACEDYGVEIVGVKKRT